MSIRKSLMISAVVAFVAPTTAATAATMVVDSYYTAFDTYEIVMEGALLANSTNTVTANAPVDVDVMGYQFEAVQGVFSGPNSGFLLGGQSDNVTVSNTSATDGLLRAYFAFSATTWDALSTTVQSAILATDGSSLTSEDVSFFDDETDGGGQTGGSGGGTVGGEVPLPAAGWLLLAGLTGLAGVKRRA